MATERSSSDSDVDLDSQIDRFDDFYFGDKGDDVEVSAATWCHQWNTLPQVTPTPRVKWLTMATERSSSDSDVDLDTQIDRFDDFYFGDKGDDVEERLGLLLLVRVNLV